MRWIYIIIAMLFVIGRVTHPMSFFSRTSSDGRHELAGDGATERLWSAINRGDLETVRQYAQVQNVTKYHVHIDHSGIATATPFIARAIENNHDQILRVLIDNGANVNDRMRFRDPAPLHIAASHGNERVIQTLLENGAHPGIKMMNAWTPMHCAACYNDTSVIRLLQSYGCLLEDEDIEGNTPLHIAARHGSNHVVDFLVLYHGKDVNQLSSESGDTPLHKAAQGGFLQAVKLLIKRGCDINANNNEGNAPLHDAVFLGRYDIVYYLLCCGARTDMISNEGYTPLHVAALAEDESVDIDTYRSIIYLLIASGAPTHLQDAENIENTAINETRDIFHNVIPNIDHFPLNTQGLHLDYNDTSEMTKVQYLKAALGRRKYDNVRTIVSYMRNKNLISLAICEVIGLATAKIDTTNDPSILQLHPDRSLLQIQSWAHEMENTHHLHYSVMATLTTQIDAGILTQKALFAHLKRYVRDEIHKNVLALYASGAGNSTLHEMARINCTKGVKSVISLMRNRTHFPNKLNRYLYNYAQQTPSDLARQKGHTEYTKDYHAALFAYQSYTYLPPQCYTP